MKTSAALLLVNSFYGHAGRPGQRGGSLPRAASYPSAQAPQGATGGGHDPGPSPYAAPPPPVFYPPPPHAYYPSPYGYPPPRPRPAYTPPPTPPRTAVDLEDHLKESNPKHSFTKQLLDQVGYQMDSLDKPGRAVRGVLGGHFREAANIIPFSDYLGITHPDDSVSGRDLLQKLGIVGHPKDGFDMGDIAGLAVEVLTDPVTWLSWGGSSLLKVGAKGSKAALASARAAARAQKLAAAAAAHASRAKRMGKINKAAQLVAFVERLLRTGMGRQMVRDARKLILRKARAAGKAFKAVKIPAKVKVAGKVIKLPTGVKRATTVGATMDRAVRAGKRIIRTTPALDKTVKTATKVSRKVSRKADKFGKYLNETAKKHKTVIHGAELIDKARLVGSGIQLIGDLSEAAQGGAAATGVKDAAVANAAADIIRTYMGKELVSNRCACKGGAEPCKCKRMETITANYANATIRREMWQGKSYLVAPATLIVEGVLNGSQGALFYPIDEITRNYRSWDGTPIVVYHPTDNQGRALSAKSPGVLDRSCIGVVRNAKVRHPKLAAELWFDEKRTKEVDPRVYQSLIKNQKIELSTGLFTDNIKAPMGAHYNGKNYDSTARNYRPDHLAILPDQVGACSLTDGCGVLVNKAKPTANKWTDAARQAALEARRAKREGDKSFHKQKAAEYRDKAAKSQKLAESSDSMDTWHSYGMGAHFAKEAGESATQTAFDILTKKIPPKAATLKGAIEGREAVAKAAKKAHTIGGIATLLGLAGGAYVGYKTAKQRRINKALDTADEHTQMAEAHEKLAANAKRIVDMYSNN